jgi:hypothetical protein
MTRKELCDALNLEHDYVSAVLTRLANPTKTQPKRVYVISYVHDAEGQRRYPRAMFSVGDRPDAKRPTSDRRNNRRRYDQARRNRIAGASVFTWGLPRRELDAIARKAVLV